MGKSINTLENHPLQEETISVQEKRPPTERIDNN